MNQPQSPPSRPPRQLTIARRSEAGVVTLSLRGEIDLASAPELESELQAVESARPRRIVLDLADLDFIDSTGIHLLMHAQQRAEALGHQLVVTHAPAPARRLFRLTGISDRLIVA